MIKIVVTGANGMVGAAVVKNLYKDYVLVAIDRHKDRIAPFIEIANGLQFVMSDILSVSDWKAILGGAYAVVHLAANVHWTPRTSEEIANFYKVNTEGTRLLINKSAEYGVKKFLFLAPMMCIEAVITRSTKVSRLMLPAYMRKPSWKQRT